MQRGVWTLPLFLVPPFWVSPLKKQNLRSPLLSPFSWKQILTPLRREGGSGGHFGMFCSYESTFYCWTAAFYGMKISCRVKKLLRFEGRPSYVFSILPTVKWEIVKKLLRFEGRPSHVFSIQIYRRNLSKIWCFLSIFFYFLTFHVLKLSKWYRLMSFTKFSWFWW